MPLELFVSLTTRPYHVRAIQSRDKSAHVHIGLETVSLFYNNRDNQGTVIANVCSELRNLVLSHESHPIKKKDTRIRMG